jgi:hypothetical protein
VEILASGIAWLLDPAHWSGSNGIPVRVLEHVALAGAALVMAALIAVPIGLYTGHTGRWGTAVTNVASLGRAVPSYALLLVFFTLTGALGAPTTLPTLVLLAIPPLLVGVHVALREVDPASSPGPSSWRCWRSPRSGPSRWWSGGCSRRGWRVTRLPSGRRRGRASDCKRALRGGQAQRVARASTPNRPTR